MMSLYDACMIAEGVDEDVDFEEFTAAWQFLIDTGACWELQGWYGRMAVRMIEDRHCTPAGENNAA
ncbi:MAG: hypothetical protein PVI97_00330 [Candidatus Thiodiazotropha sp.]|jgi:hypothetical protein